MTPDPPHQQEPSPWVLWVLVVVEVVVLVLVVGWVTGLVPWP